MSKEFLFFGHACGESDQHKLERAVLKACDRFRTQFQHPATRHLESEGDASTSGTQPHVIFISTGPLVPVEPIDLLRSYLQRLRFSLEPGSSAVVVDWLGAGRVAKGECWAFKEYRSQLEFMWSEGHHQAHPTEEPGRVKPW